MGSGEADSDCACSCADTEPVIKGVSIIGDCCLLPDSLISAMTPGILANLTATLRNASRRVAENKGMVNNRINKVAMP